MRRAAEWKSDSSLGSAEMSLRSLEAYSSERIKCKHAIYRLCCQRESPMRVCTATGHLPVSRARAGTAYAGGYADIKVKSGCVPTVRPCHVSSAAESESGGGARQGRGAETPSTSECEGGFSASTARPSLHDSRGLVKSGFTCTPLRPTHGGSLHRVVRALARAAAR